MEPLSKTQIVAIFAQIKQSHPGLLVDRQTGKEYTADHPAAESMAQIFKMQLEQEGSLSARIEEGKQKCLAKTGSASDGHDMGRRRDPLGEVAYSAMSGSATPPAPHSLGDYIKVVDKKKKHKKKLLS